MKKKPAKSANMPSFRHDIVRISLCLLFLFGFLLGNRPLSVPDEARYSEIPREMLVAHDYLTPTLNGLSYFEKPPLLYWIQAASLHTFDFNEWGSRIPTALFGLIGCIWIYALGRALYGRLAGLLSCGVLASSTLYFIFTHVVTIDMLLTLLLTLILGSFLWVSESQNTKSHRTSETLHQHANTILYVAYIATAGAILAKGLVGILLPAAIIGLWFISTRRWSLILQLKILQGLGIILLLAAPWHIEISSIHPEFPQFYFIDQQFSRYLTDIAQRSQPFWFFIPIILSGWLPWVVFLPASIKATFKNCWLPHNHSQLFLLLWAGGIFLFFSASHSKLVPYILPAFPPMALMIGHYLAEQWNKNTQSNQAAFWVLTIIGIIALLTCIILPSQLPVVTNAVESRLYFYLLGFCIGASFFSSAWLGLRGQFRNAIIVLMLSYSTVLFTIVLATPHIDTRSIKSLALTLQQQSTPHDVIIMYDLYYQDLPFYLRRAPLVVLNGWGELEFGTVHANPHPSWMWMRNDFSRWLKKYAADPGVNIWMVITKPRYLALPEAQQQLFIVKGSTADNFLLRYKK